VSFAFERKHYFELKHSINGISSKPHGQLSMLVFRANFVLMVLAAMLLISKLPLNDTYRPVSRW
jgi:hypothetical protein